MIGVTGLMARAADLYESQDGYRGGWPGRTIVWRFSIMDLSLVFMPGYLIARPRHRSVQPPAREVLPFRW